MTKLVTEILCLFHPCSEKISKNYYTFSFIFVFFPVPGLGAEQIYTCLLNNKKCNLSGKTAWFSLLKALTKSQTVP